MLNPEPKATPKKISVADSANYGYIGLLRNVPKIFCGIRFYMDFVMIKNAPWGMVFGLPQLRRMRAVIDLGNIYVFIIHSENKMRIALEPDRRQPLVEQGGPESDFFHSPYIPRSQLTLYG